MIINELWCCSQIKTQYLEAIVATLLFWYALMALIALFGLKAVALWESSPLRTCFTGSLRQSDSDFHWFANIGGAKKQKLTRREHGTGNKTPKNKETAINLQNG